MGDMVRLQRHGDWRLSKSIIRRSTRSQRAAPGGVPVRAAGASSPRPACGRRCWRAGARRSSPAPISASSTNRRARFRPPTSVPHGRLTEAGGGGDARHRTRRPGSRLRWPAMRGSCRRTAALVCRKAASACSRRRRHQRRRAWPVPWRHSTWSSTGRHVPADEALKLGLVDEITTDLRAGDAARPRARRRGNLAACARPRGSALRPRRLRCRGAGHPQAGTRRASAGRCGRGGRPLPRSRF